MAEKRWIDIDALTEYMQQHPHSAPMLARVFCLNPHKSDEPYRSNPKELINALRQQNPVLLENYSEEVIHYDPIYKKKVGSKSFFRKSGWLELPQIEKELTTFVTSLEETITKFSYDASSKADSVSISLANGSKLNSFAGVKTFYPTAPEQEKNICSVKYEVEFRGGDIKALFSYQGKPVREHDGGSYGGHRIEHRGSFTLEKTVKVNNFTGSDRSFYHQLRRIVHQ